MSEVAVQHGVAEVYEPSLFGTYSKKIGMWLFLLSDTLTFGLCCLPTATDAFRIPTGPRLSAKKASPTLTIHDRMPALQFLDDGAGGACGRRGDRAWTRQLDPLHHAFSAQRSSCCTDWNGRT